MNFGINKGVSAIDAAAVKDVASQIFANAAQKDIQNQTFKVDYSKFNRPELGADLYSQRLDINQVQQIAVRNAGLDTNFQQNQAIVASVQYLNKIAALGSYAMPNTMDGKINVPQEAKQQDINSREVFALPASSITTEIQDLNSNRKGSNPFNFITLTVDEREDEKDSKNAGI